MQLRSARERTIQTLCYEAGGILLISPLYALAVDASLTESATLLVALSAAMLLWTPLHNTARLRRIEAHPPLRQRPPAWLAARPRRLARGHRCNRHGSHHHVPDRLRTLERACRRSRPDRRLRLLRICLPSRLRPDVADRSGTPARLTARPAPPHTRLQRGLTSAAGALPSPNVKGGALTCAS